MKALLTLMVFFSLNALSHPPEDYSILSLEKRAQVIDQIINERVDTVLPSLMKRTGIDMWLVISREYNEDPIIKTMLPANWLSARRRTILVMYLSPEEKAKANPSVETLAVARYAVGEKFASAWDKEQQPDQWQRLVEIIEERQPQTIGINISGTYGLADGLNATEKALLEKHLPSKYQDKLVSAEKLAIGWLETRSNLEMELYPAIVGIAHKIIAEAFSEKVIVPGQTTTDEVVWWLREKVASLKLDVWFHPTVSIQRDDKQDFDHITAFSKSKSSNVILPGDLLHTDFGITYLRLNTDTQQHAYVTKACEKDVPSDLVEALATGNRLQDILTSHFKTGLMGNEILKRARKDAIDEGITPSIYSHPIGFHGHGAGPSIGMWDNQQGVKTGDYPVYDDTAYSIELNVAINLPSWQKTIRIMLEEDALHRNGTIDYLHDRQKKWHVIRTPCENGLGF